ncbi:N-acetyl-gamma-glutamyl-phosphate reductase [Kamptonema cortianum]|nr:N-acetyl-gamma-glutamyl-phosphate reductase [Kamptonema cortianum]
MNQKIKVAVIGASGYSGEQLVELLLKHPGVDLAAVTSRQYDGKLLTEVFPALHTRSKLRFCAPDPEQIARDAEVVFLALPHGVASEFAIPLVKAGLRVFDLSADFRLRSPEVYREFYQHEHPAPELLSKAVYGLPEVYREEIKSSTLIACPGCYPTSILLPTLPLLQKGWIDPTRITADCLSGVSGAGRKAELDYLYVECNESLRPYGVPKHRHLSEIEQELTLGCQRAGHSSAKIMISFTPHLVPVSRGILSSLYYEMSSDFLAEFTSHPDEASKQIAALYEGAYAHEPFVALLGDKRLPDTKNVVGTNFVEIAFRIDWRMKRILCFSAIDNILKGASGQAIQAFNISSGFPENTGLN